MSKSLTSYLEQQGGISPSQIREARRSQKFFGGSLLCNLTRVKAISPDEAMRLQADWMGFPYADLKALKEIPAHILQMVSPEDAARRRVLPFITDDEGLGIATSRIGNSPFFSQLTSASEQQVVPHSIMEEHLEPLLEKYYGIPSPSRETVRLASVDDPLGGWDQAGKATSQPEPAPAGGLSEVGLDGLPINAEVAPSQLLPTESDHPMALLDTVETIDDSRRYDFPEAPGLEDDEDPPAARAGRFGQADDPGVGVVSALHRLARAHDRREIGEAAVRHAVEQGVRRVALLGLRTQNLVGWQAGGEDLELPRFDRLSIPLYVPSIFAGFKTGVAIYHGIVPDQPANNDFLAALGPGERPGVATVLPVVLKGRAAAVIYGDSGPGSAQPVDRELLEKLAGKVAAALEILVLRHKILS